MTPEIARQLLYSMKRIRCVEETIAARYAEQKMRCPTHLSTGQEAVARASCIDGLHCLRGSVIALPLPQQPRAPRSALHR